MAEKKEKYCAVFRPTGDGPPPIVRMRRLLKYALRACGLRCVEIRPARDDETKCQQPLF